MLPKASDLCTHCGGKLSAVKPITEGPRAGQTKRVCFKCGHAEYHGAPSGTLPPEYVQRHKEEIE